MRNFLAWCFVQIWPVFVLALGLCVGLIWYFENHAVRDRIVIREDGRYEVQRRTTPVDWYTVYGGPYATLDEARAELRRRLESKAAAAAEEKIKRTVVEYGLGTEK